MNAHLRIIEGRFIREPFEAIRPTSEAYIVKGMLPAGPGVGFINAPSGSYKTFLATDWGLRIAAGESVCGRRTRACGVIYVAAEAPEGVRRRVKAFRAARGSNPRPFELIGQAPDLRNRQNVMALGAEIASAEDDMSMPVGLVIIDTLAATIAGADENAAGDMSQVMSNAHALAASTGALVLIISHAGKDEGRGIRGWSGQHAAADVVITLSREENGKLAIGRVAKLKEGEDGFRFAFSLEQVVLGIDDDGDEITSAVVTYEAAPAASGKPRKQRALNPGEQVVLAAIKHVTDNGATHPLPVTIQGAKPWQKGVTKADVKARALASGFAADGEKPNTVTVRFSRSLQGLTAAGKVRIEGETVWLMEGVTR